MKSLHPALLLLPALLLPACGDPTRPLPPSKDKPASETKKENPANDHGDKTDLGVLVLGGNKFRIVRLGKLIPGKEGAFEVLPQGASSDDIARWNLYLWVEDEAGAQLSAPSKGNIEGARLHFHVTPRQSEKTPTKVVLRLRSEGKDTRAKLPLDGHGHEHNDGPHHGIPAKFAGDGGGTLELKLHDDKGDLELWLYQDAEHSKPFDLPLAASVEIEFIDADGRKVSLRPRNTEKNEDEAGEPNVRDGGTNYFIYPSKEGEDASWLKGKAFQSIVIVRFSLDDKKSASEEFILKPHVH
ncbi:MAG: hypothetical protein OSB83_13585 [Planctomycetota bacterium]|nr:hypothetical protein [Planctomycetota bacterium]